jgi:hypothetical protein
LVLGAAACRRENGIKIIDQFQVQRLDGEVVVRGETDLTVAFFMTVTDSALILSLSTLGKNVGDPLCEAYDLRGFQKIASFAPVGRGPNEYTIPIPFHSNRGKDNSFRFFDGNHYSVNTAKVLKDTVVVTTSRGNPEVLAATFNLSETGSGLFFGSRSGHSAGIYFRYDPADGSLQWPVYRSEFDSYLSPSEVATLYYNTTCIHEEREMVVVAPRYFNKLLFFDFDGKLLKEIQVGKEKWSPAWDGHRKSMDYELSKTFFLYMCTTDKYVYCLSTRDADENGVIPPSRIHVFDWDFQYVTTFQMDRAVGRIVVNHDDSWMLSACDDGTGLTDIVKYDLSRVLEKGAVEK